MAKMLANPIQLRVCTPTRTVLEKDVEFVLLRTIRGDMGVLHGHLPCAVQLDYGLLRAKIGKRETDVLMVMGGFASVGESSVTVLTDVAETPDNIEALLASMAEERAQNKLKEQKADLEMHRAELALRRSLVEMDLSSYAILKGQEPKDDE